MPDEMIKCNVVEERRTPNEEIKRADENWDKEAASVFTIPPPPPAPPMPVITPKGK